MNRRALQLALRTVAVIIALAAVVDPAITTERSARPDIALVNDARDSTLALNVARALNRKFNVVRAPLGTAIALVSVGSQIPPAATSDMMRGAGVPSFAVLPDSTVATVRIASVAVAARAPLDARVPVAVALHAMAPATDVTVELSVDDIAVDRQTARLAGKRANDTLLTSLAFVPTRVGPARVRVNARAGVYATSVDRVVDVENRRWTVLFYDPRPSWMSTFVRRALERDPRFVVTSRTVTSNGVSTDAGQPPASLGDRTVLDPYDAIVVGAPNALGERDVAGLRAFLEARGGGVALLYDERTAGRADLLTEGGPSEGATNAQSVRAGVDGDSVALRMTEWAWPGRVPAGARVLAAVGEHAVVWERGLGAGRLLVSGALDSWKFRDPAQSGFEAFWQGRIGELADASPAAVELQLPDAPVAVGSSFVVRVTSRAAALGAALASTGVTASARPTRAVASAMLAVPNAAQAIRLSPLPAPGRFEGSARAPDSAGVYSVVATVDGQRVSRSLRVVRDVVERAESGDASLLAAWTAARGGRAIAARELDGLASTIEATVEAPARRVRWHPMRVAWWLVPFVLALSAEWWLRRRQGLP